MQSLLLSWVVWLTLAAKLLNTGVAFLLADPCFPQSSSSVPVVAQSAPESHDSLFKETSSVPQELSLQCARQSKQIFVLARARTPFPNAQERDGHLRPVPAEVLPPAALFFSPRKLSPPAEDEPFLS
jgi:hypothetical protein